MNINIKFIIFLNNFKLWINSQEYFSKTSSDKLTYLGEICQMEVKPNSGLMCRCHCVLREHSVRAIWRFLGFWLYFSNNSLVTFSFRAYNALCSCCNLGSFSMPLTFLHTSLTEHKFKRWPHLVSYTTLPRCVPQVKGLFWCKCMVLLVKFLYVTRDYTFLNILMSLLWRVRDYIFQLCDWQVQIQRDFSIVKWPFRL